MTAASVPGLRRGYLQAPSFPQVRSNGKYGCDVRYLNGAAEHARFPALEVGTRFEAYELGASSDFPLTEESVQEALSAVHGGCRDWTLTLGEADGKTAVTVVPA